MARTEAPVSRDLIDVALPALRLILGFAFVAYSASTTIRHAANDITFLFGLRDSVMTIGYIADIYWYSSALAVLVFVGEVATGEKHPRVYRLFLVPDAFYTSRDMQAGLQTALTTIFETVMRGSAATAVASKATVAAQSGGSDLVGGAAFVLALFVSWVVSLIFGYYVAKWGEVLIFGPRRTRRVSVKEA